MQNNINKGGMSFNGQRWSLSLKSIRKWVYIYIYLRNITIKILNFRYCMQNKEGVTLRPKTKSLLNIKT